MTLNESGFIVATLLIALIALLLVIAARRDARVVRDNARRDAEKLLAHTERRDDESRQRAQELTDRENRLVVQERSLADSHRELAEQQETIRRDRDELDQRLAQELARIAEMSVEQATAELRDRVARDNEAYVRSTLRDREVVVKQQSTQTSQRILADAMSRIAVAATSRLTQEAVELPSADFRGRIIGKEGRNIRTFEAVTGVDVILDDDSSSVVLSSFDAERRDVAVTAMKELIADGRIHPGRIEEVVHDARESMTPRTVAAGYDAVKESGVGTLSPELVAQLGRLRFRTSYSQNVLDHCVETALIAGLLAEELGADGALARRAGLLHDIGKILTPAQQGSHARLGAQLVLELGESEDVAHCVRAHHGEEDFRSVEAVLVQIADSISAARPGARRDDVTSYVERITQLEALVAQRTGVNQVYAVSSGHEMRVIVDPGAIDDEDLPTLAQEIASQVQQHTTFPGEVVITVIRETRSSSRAG
ncbi:ribonuclease Y [Jonesia quinghaiensis]|uniref:ribonuclease Y n=1 Tax=Jonesia quinghaiensis TaxID=262806 RepID=UPI000423405D|nr:ribonuclease Y [Jonesia quinghaiensis]